MSSRSRPAPVTFDTTSIQTPPRLPERPLAAGGWRLPEGYTAGVQDRDSHPAGLWKGLEMTRRLVREERACLASGRPLQVEGAPTRKGRP